MEKNSNKEYFRSNKRRAEGLDKNDNPKKTQTCHLNSKSLHLKTFNHNSTNTTTTCCYVQILGNGMDTLDTSPSVLLFFDNQRYIFNAGEGLQRYCTEHKIKLSKLNYILLSRVCSETASGLPGLLLTLAGMGEGKSVKVWGPSDLKYLVDAMSSFIPNAVMPEQIYFKDPIVVSDEFVKISAFLLQPKLSEGKPGDTSVVYVCELPEIMKFDRVKAEAFGVKPGPKYRQLVEGHSVKSDRQDIMVHPSDVMGPSIPGPIIFVVDCPTESHLQELLSIQHLNSYFADFSSQPESSKGVSCIIHLSPASVVSSPKYQKWMKRFGSSQHIMAGHESKNMEIPILKSSARIAARLNYLCPHFFPAPGFVPFSTLVAQRQTPLFQDSELKLCESVAAENLLKFFLRPVHKHGLDRSCIPSSMVPAEIIDELRSEIPDIAVATQHVSQLWHASIGSTGEISSTLDVKVMVEEPWLNEKTLPSCLEFIRRDDLEIVFLGTGSSQPSKYRNVSSIHINLFSKGGLLLDCGEGTLGQLKRRYGIDGADNAVRGLRGIWISHIHADHHAGLARILSLRRDLLKEEPHEPVLVVGPRQLKRYLDAYQILEDLDMMFLDCWHTTEASLNAFKGITESSNNPVDNAAGMKSLKKVLGDAGLEALISFPVVHCPQAFGVVLKAAERTNSKGELIPGWKVVYSGDTRPCPELVEASHGATVLIHEATFEDGMVEEAVAKNHSTTGEAIEMGNSAGAYRIILTHFSQRYPKIPVFDETHMHNTCIAFDMMSVNAADLPVLPRVLPYLKLLFRNEML